jgi:hypothetical protein
MKNLVSLVAVLALTAGSQAAIQVVDLGTGAPPASIGGYTMVPFGDDTRAVFADVSGVGVAEGSPFGSIGFSPDLSHREIGNGWSTWSHGYTGDVYYSNGATSVSITLAPMTGAFYFYAEPNPFGQFTITASSGQTSISLSVEGDAGANGFGFYTDDFSALTSITVTSDVDFAIGEFGAARVPAPGAGALALAGLGMIARRRR